MTDLSALFDKLREEYREEGEQRKEAEDIKEVQEAILRLLDRKGITPSAYQEDIERFQHLREATQFLEDFATASDPAAFLKGRFGH